MPTPSSASHRPDKTIVKEQRRTETWHKQGGGWLLIAAQWDNTPVNFRTPSAVDSSVFKDYVGRYEWRPGDVIDTVTEKDGRLWSRFGDESTVIDETYSYGRSTSLCICSTARPLDRGAVSGQSTNNSI
jgi:hypothetical protein